MRWYPVGKFAEIAESIGGEERIGTDAEARKEVVTRKRVVKFSIISIKDGESGNVEL